MKDDTCTFFIVFSSIYTTVYCKDFEMETLHANKRIKEQLVQTKLPVKNKNMLKKL